MILLHFGIKFPLGSDVNLKNLNTKIMKRIALIVPLAIGVLSCSQLDLEDKVVALQQENKQLLESSLQKDQSLAEFLTSFTDI